ncbi:MAG: heavy-metal-associated domain-containing protein [Anaerolineales bacterium]|jgi:copper chaperone CopZ
MEELILNMPAMYGDHHVLKVRAALEDLEGIEEIYASAAWKQLMVSYDPKQVKPAEIEKVLTEAGYPPNAGEPPMLVHLTNIKRDPQWELLGVRVTETNPADLK